MIPNDERISAAMHSIEPEVSDVPDLYERVARGAKRRRHYRSGATVAGAAVVVMAAALVPALAHSSSTSGAPTLAGPGGDIDPGFTGQSSRPGDSTARSTVSPTTVSPTPTAVTATVPVKLPADAKGCPTVASVTPGASAEAQAKAAALAAVPKRYGAKAAASASVQQVYAAASGKGYGIVADAICGKTLGDNSYVVELSFANTVGSASMGNGQLFVADFGDLGWQVWFQYH